MTLHPMEFSDILDAIFSLYRRHFQLFLGIAVVYLVGELGSQLLEDFPWFVHQHLLLKLIEYILIGLFTFLRLVSLSAIVVASATLYMGGQITGRAALRQTLQRFFPLLSCAIVWILVVIIVNSKNKYTLPAPGRCGFLTAPVRSVQLIIGSTIVWRLQLLVVHLPSILGCVGGSSSKLYYLRRLLYGTHSDEAVSLSVICGGGSVERWLQFY